MRLEPLSSFEIDACWHPIASASAACDIPECLRHLAISLPRERLKSSTNAPFRQQRMLVYDIIP